MFVFSTFQMKCPMSIRVRCKDDETLEIMNITMRFQRHLSTTCFTKVVFTVDKKMKLLEITLNINLIHCLQARSSLYANTHLRAHRRAENKNKEQKKNKE